MYLNYQLISNVKIDMNAVHLSCQWLATPLSRCSEIAVSIGVFGIDQTTSKGFREAK